MAFKSNMLFDVLANILSTKSLKLYEEHISSENYKDASKFMILKYISMHSNPFVRDVVLDNYVSLERMPEEKVYLWLMSKVPKQKNTFIKYIR